MLNNVTFHRILVIFIVGLVSRSVVNYVYDVNVFKDYMESISLTYYAFMAWFTVFVHSLPKISFNVFDIKLVKGVIKLFCEGNNILGERGKLLMGDKSDESRTKVLDKNKILKDGLNLRQDRHNSSKTGESSGEASSSLANKGKLVMSSNYINSVEQT
jgi:hypothetical protein